MRKSARSGLSAIVLAVATLIPGCETQKGSVEKEHIGGSVYCYNEGNKIEYEMIGKNKMIEVISMNFPENLNYKKESKTY